MCVCVWGGGVFSECGSMIQWVLGSSSVFGMWKCMGCGSTGLGGGSKPESGLQMLVTKSSHVQ